MFFEILHLSDLHFGNPDAHLRRNEVRRILDSLLSKVDAPKSFLIISGDIIFKGNREGYGEALEAINTAIEHHKLDRSRILLCPGNHDIVKKMLGQQCFTSFDEWSSGIRADKKCTFAGTSARLIENELGYFLLINTAYHLDCHMGLVDVAAVETLLNSLPPFDTDTPQRLRVAITHHHIIPVLPDDTSTTRNAYQLVQLLEKHGFSALLHGHQHAMLKINIGSHKMLLSGVGSFGFSTPGYMNSVAIYRGRSAIETVERYGLTIDSSSGTVRILPN